MKINTVWLFRRLNELHKPRFEGECISIPIGSVWNEFVTYEELVNSKEPSNTRFRILQLVATSYHKDGKVYLQWDMLL